MFPLCDRLNIGWSFWSYKKMNCKNSPVTFARPTGWDMLMEHINAGKMLSLEQARDIFDEFLDCISHPIYQDSVVCALTREPPFTLPCEAFDESLIQSQRLPGAELRMSEQASLLFRDGHTGAPDYRRLKGEPQPEEENIVVRLKAGDEIGYYINIANAPANGRLLAHGEGKIELTVDHMPVENVRMDHGEYSFTIHQAGKLMLSIRCLKGEIDVDRIVIE
jgi:hypothetical protein